MSKSQAGIMIEQRFFKENQAYTLKLLLFGLTELLFR